MRKLIIAAAAAAAVFAVPSSAPASTADVGPCDPPPNVVGCAVEWYEFACDQLVTPCANYYVQVICRKVFYEECVIETRREG